MLTEICGYLRNWFTRRPDGTDVPKVKGEFTISDGIIQGVDLLEGQCYRILGSVLNDGVYEFHADEPVLRDETFTGEVWPMLVPIDVVNLDREIETWIEKNGEAVSGVFSSENLSASGYSYSLKGSGEIAGANWQTAFATRLSRYMKL